MAKIAKMHLQVQIWFTLEGYWLRTKLLVLPVVVAVAAVATRTKAMLAAATNFKTSTCKTQAGRLGGGKMHC
jgi:uncharacterized membrane protein SirB2